MLKQTMSLALAAALLCVMAARPAHALQQKQSEEARRVEKVKERVAKFHKKGTRRVEVKLKDGRKFKGRVAEATPSEFVLANSKDGNFVTLRYDEVKEVKYDRPGNAALTLIGTGATLAIVIIVALTSLDEQ